MLRLAKGWYHIARDPLCLECFQLKSLHIYVSGVGFPCPKGEPTLAISKLLERIRNV